MADSSFPFYRPGRSEYEDSVSRSSFSVKGKKKKSDDDKFALGRRGILVFFTLSVLTLMAALDGTSLSVALPVSSHERLRQPPSNQARISRKNLMEQLSKHSGVEPRFCCAQLVSLILKFQTFRMLILHSSSVPA
jgi:hypothetical protein